MGIPLAVSPTVKSPGLFLVVNLLAGQSSPGTSPFRALVIAAKSAAGTITPDNQLVEAVAGEDAAKGLLGPGTAGHLALKALFRENGLALVDLVAPLKPAGVKADGTITFSAGPPVKAWDVYVEIAGREYQLAWLVGESNDDIRDKLIAAVNAATDDLPVVASAPGPAGQVKLEAKIEGTWGNEIELHARLENGTTGAVAASPALTGGVGEFDIQNVLTLIQAKEYNLILLCTSTADAKAASATSGPGRLVTDVEARASGSAAKLQQIVVGSTGTLTAIKPGSDQHNFERMEYVFCNEGRSLGPEWGGAEVGARMREEALDPAANRIQQPYRATLHGPKDLASDELTEIEVEDALNSGITPITFDASKTPRPDRPITTHFKDSNGNPDDRVLDTSKVTGIDAVARDLRTSIPRQFGATSEQPGAKVITDAAAALTDEVPAGVVSESDIRSHVDGRVLFFVSQGVVKADEYAQAKEDGTFIVRVNPQDETQVDIVLPTDIVPPLAKISLVVQKT